MPHLPELERFARLAAAHRLVPVYRRLFADDITPLSVFARLDAGECGCLFESVVGGEKVGRYSFLGADPFMRFDAYGNEIRITRDGVSETFTCPDPLGELERRMAPFCPAHLPELPPFTSGAIGYASYDAVRYVEHLPDCPPDDLHLPDLSYAFYDRLVVFDNATKSLDVVVLAHILDPSPEGVAAAHTEACRRIDATIERLFTPSSWPPPADIDRHATLQSLDLGTVPCTFSPAAFLEAVNRALEYIRAGDIFQVVLSQRLHARTSADPHSIYRALRVINPSPYMFMLRLEGLDIVGASPEVMVKVEDGLMTVRPIAGTRPRGKTDEEDKALEDELLADPKELAEHMMLVDLARNDIARVSEPGSRMVTEMLITERYESVMHLVSNVKGKLRGDLDALSAYLATMNMGTLTGAPKIEAMKIIRRLEKNKRGYYGGAVMYLTVDGQFDSCITIRSLQVRDHQAYIRAGAGIVHDSVPDTEFDETQHKANSCLKAIRMASENKNQ